jgi:plastocyanin
MREPSCRQAPRGAGPTSVCVLGSLTWVVAVILAGCGDSQPDGQAIESPEPEGVYGTASPAVGGTPSVVSLRTVADPDPAPADDDEPRDSPVMDQLGLVFTPVTLVVRLGEPVVFTNSETLVHNVHVRFTDTDSTVLNVETDPGARVEFTFEREGGYDVTCEHHPGMRAFIYVTDASRTVFADAAGTFVIGDVPPGEYTLSVWSVDPELRVEQRLEVAEGSTEVTFGPP